MPLQKPKGDPAQVVETKNRFRNGKSLKTIEPSKEPKMKG
jgi:hypothetical protein